MDRVSRSGEMSAEPNHSVWAGASRRLHGARAGSTFPAPRRTDTSPAVTEHMSATSCHRNRVARWAIAALPARRPRPRSPVNGRRHRARRARPAATAGAKNGRFRIAGSRLAPPPLDPLGRLPPAVTQLGESSGFQGYSHFTRIVGIVGSRNVRRLALRERERLERRARRVAGIVALAKPRAESERPDFVEPDTVTVDEIERIVI